MTARTRSGELFAGVGGLGMAVNAVFGSEPAWFAEFDEAPSQVLAARYPGVPNHGDVTKITTVEHVEILAGGFPCQDVSLAGRRRGMKDGTRSGLWSEFARLIDLVRPDWVVIENVRGLLSADASGGDLEPCPWCVGDDQGVHTLRALGAVLGDLDDLGFDAEWTSIRASDVGAPHGRFRVFILAWPRERTTSDAGRSGGRGRAEGSEPSGRDDASVGSDSRGDGRREYPGLKLLPTPAVVQNDGESVESWMARRERIKATGINGNGMGMPLPIAVQLLPTPVVTDAASAARHTTSPGAMHSGTTLTDAVRLLPTPEAKLAGSGPDYARMGRVDSGGDDLTTTIWKNGLHLLPTPSVSNSHGNETNGRGEALLPGAVNLLPTPNVAMATGGQTSRSGSRKDELLLGGIAAEHETDWGQYTAAIRRWEEVIGRPAPAPVRMDGRGGKPRLNPELTEWMMGWPAGWVTDPAIGLPRAKQLQACGNGVVTQQAIAALWILLSREGVPSL